MKEEYKKLMEFESVKNYLNSSIGSKGTQIKTNQSTLEEKIESINLTNYLRGIVLFFEYSDQFNNPFELIDFCSKNRSDIPIMNQLKKHIDDFVSWLSKKYTPKSCIAYQAMIRGFLTHNGFQQKWKNYKENSEFSKELDKFGISFTEFKHIGDRIIEYIKDFECKTAVKWMRISGLGINEIITVKFLELRHKDFDNTYIRFSGIRRKNGIKFISFFYGLVKESIQKLMKNRIDSLKTKFNKKTEQELKGLLIKMDYNSKRLSKFDKKDYKTRKTTSLKDKYIQILIDESYLFGDKPSEIAHNFRRMFNRAYDNCIEKEFPRYIDSNSRLFTFHKYRHVFTEICKEIRIPRHIENIFIAHTTHGNDKSYTKPNKLLEYFKEVQDEIFGIRKSSTRQQIEKEIIENLTRVLTNDGKRKVIYEQYLKDDTNEEELTNETTMNIFIQRLLIKAQEMFLKNEFFMNKMFDSFIERLNK